MLRKTRIEQKVLEHLQPLYFAVEDESQFHHVPQGAETHFKLILATELFSDLKPVQRHRLVNSLLADEFHCGLHALSLHLYSPNEWQLKQTDVPDSPACRDGYRHG